MGKPYAWEDEEYTRKIKASRKSTEKKTKSLWRFPLILSAACYLLMLLGTPICRLIFSVGEEPVEAMLKAEFYGMVAYFAFLFLPLIICLLLYLKTLIVNPMRDRAELLRTSDSPDAEERRQTYLNQYERYTKSKSLGWRTHAFFYVILAVELALATHSVFFTSAPHETALLYSDLSLLRAGDIPVYEGSFLPTDRPLHNTYGYVMIPDKDYYYFSTDIGTLRCAKRNLLSNELMQATYRVEYLPGTYTVVLVANSSGVMLTGTGGSAAPNPPDGYWLYGDLIVRSCTEVYGYDWLTADGQATFDLMYGEYYSDAVARGDGGTHRFNLPAPIPKDEYRRVLSLYEAATYQEGGKPWGYDTNDDGTVAKMYVGGSRYGYGPPDPRTMYFDVLERCAEIVSAMPQELDEVGKCYYLARYLAEHVMSYSGQLPQTQFQDSQGITLTVSVPDPVWTTAYGALFEGRASCTGYASAFSALCREAGIACIYIKGEVPDGDHAWNMVRIDGEWYHIDTMWMNHYGEIDETYFLADDAQIAATHRPVSYGDLKRVPVSGASAQSWLYRQERVFPDADAAIAYLQKEHPDTFYQFRCIRIDDPEELLAFITRVQNGEAGELDAAVRSDDPVIRVYRRDFNPSKVYWREIQIDTHYQGIKPTEPDLSYLLFILKDDRARELTEALYDVFSGWTLYKGWEYDAADPDLNFIAYSALMHTYPVAWSEASALYPEYYDAELAPLSGQTLIPGAEDGYMAWHVEQTAEKLFGISGIPFYDIWEDARTATSRPDQPADWVYDSLHHMYMRKSFPEPQSEWYSSDFVLLEYTEYDDSAEMIAAAVNYLHYSDRPDNLDIRENDDPEVIEYCKNDAPRVQIVFDKLSDGSLRLRTFKWTD